MNIKETNKLAINKLEKKNTLFSLYNTQIKAVLTAVILILLIYYVPDVLDAVNIDIISLTLGSLAVLIGVPTLLIIISFTLVILHRLMFHIGVIFELIYISIMTIKIQLQNIRYIPFTKEECEKLYISNCDEYLSAVNQLLLPYSKSMLIFFPNKLYKEVSQFIKNEYSYNITIVKTREGLKRWR